MSAQHTPGPWNVCTDDVVHIGTECFVGRLSGPASMGKANARLIAAAPDLLAALKEVIPYMESAETAGLVGDEGCHWPVERARAAIAKAEGR